MAKISQRRPFDFQIASLACYLEMSNSDGEFMGSGFLYGVTDPPAEVSTTEPYWSRVVGAYLVTNRHVIYGLSEDEKRPKSFSINIKKEDSTTTSIRQTIDLSESEMETSIYVHPDPNVDVALVDLTERVSELPRGIPFQAKDLIHNNTMIDVECTDDVVVVGYPRGYYDQTNHFPIVKKGIISTQWSAFFDGEPYFLIDAKLFPGSSGSAVLTKPVDAVFKDGQTYRHDTGKQSAILGVFSGEPYLGEEDDPEYVDVGIVWYAHTIEQVLQTKQMWSKQQSPTVSIGSMLRPLRRRNIV